MKPGPGPSTEPQAFTRAFTQTSPQPFVWPPGAPGADAETERPLVRSPAHPNPDLAGGIRLDRVTRTLDSIETHLLGRTRLAFDLWARRTGWKREAADRFCWRCAGSIGPHESDGEGCAVCRTKPLPWDRALRLGRYEGRLKDEIKALKFSAWRPTGRGLGKHLGLAILDRLELAQIAPTEAAIVPVPMHRFRRIRRGVDHTCVLARGASSASGCPLLNLLGAKRRPEQLGLSMTARARNIKNGFFISKRAMRRHVRDSGSPLRAYILVDDVRTTGATFVASAKALRGGIRSGFEGSGPGNEGLNDGGGEAGFIWTACIAVAGESGRRDGSEKGSDEALADTRI